MTTDVNTYDIELPAEFRSGNSIPVERARITRERMTEILQDAIKADRQRRSEPVVLATHHVNELSSAIAQAVLQSPEIQALRKDAERYRWLRDMIKNQDLTIAKVGSWSLESWSGDDPDHYIDACMENNDASN